MNVFVLATHNPHKVEELRRILAEVLPGCELHGYSGPQPVEDGTSFAENALIKARAANKYTGLPTLADDSGLVVPALGGEPGVYSARYAGTRNDVDNYRLLLENLSAVPDRSASFVCAAALVDGDKELVCHGIWPGVILEKPQGAHGFGYDPVFLPHGYPVSAATLDPVAKDTISHRALAFTALAKKITGDYRQS